MVDHWRDNTAREAEEQESDKYQARMTCQPWCYDSRQLPIKGPGFLSAHSVMYHLPKS